MKALFYLAIALSLGLGAYLVSYNLIESQISPPGDSSDSSAWLQREFHLSDEQFAQVKKLDNEYVPRCMLMCAKIQESHEALKKLILANSGMTPEIKAAIQRDTEVQAECRTAMLQHFYELAKVLPEDQRQRFLETMQAPVVRTEEASQMAAMPR